MGILLGRTFSQLSLISILFSSFAFLILFWFNFINFWHFFRYARAYWDKYKEILTKLIAKLFESLLRSCKRLNTETAELLITKKGDVQRILQS